MHPETRVGGLPGHVLAVLPLASAVAIASAQPAASEPPEADPGLRPAAALTGAAVAASAIGTGLAAAALERARAHAEEELREPPCEFQCIDIVSALDVPVLLSVGIAFNAQSLALSALAGHFWARRDGARHRNDRRRALATTVVGSFTLAAGLALHVAGLILPGTGCGDLPSEAAVPCWRRTTNSGIAMMSVGTFAFDTGAGLLAYGGTMLRARPTLSGSRSGAVVGLRFAF